MIIMQIAQTETPPTDENFPLGSLGFQKKVCFATYKKLYKYRQQLQTSLIYNRQLFLLI